MMSKQSGDRIIRNDILQLLLTIPGERVMRPDWGTLLKPSLFEMNDEAARNALASNITRQLARYEPRISVTSIEVEADTVDETIMHIRIEGVYTNEPNRLFEQDLQVSITGGE